MSRRSAKIKKPINPDPKFNDRLVTQFVSCLMKRGKKSTAENIIYDAIEQLGKKSGDEGLDVFHKAINNVKPVLEVRSRRVGGATYQVPVEVRPERRTALAMRWIISYSRSRREKDMSERLAAELILASKGEGESIKKKEDTHRMAEANRAFAHYRW